MASNIFHPDSRSTMFEKHANWLAGTIDFAMSYAEPYEPVGFGVDGLVDVDVGVCVGDCVGVAVGNG